MNKKGLIIGLIAGAVVGIGAIVKYLNDEREEIETGNVKVTDDGETVVETRQETVKEVVIRKVNNGLEWVSNNPEKTAAATRVIEGVATAIGVVTGAVELYSSIKDIKDDSNKKILAELKAVNKKLDDASINPFIFNSYEKF